MIRVSMGIPGQRPGAIDARLGDGSVYCSDALKEDVVGVIRWPTSEVDTFSLAVPDRSLALRLDR